MRLKEFQVKQICQTVLSTLRTKQLIILKQTDTEVLRRMQEIFIKDLKVEDEIHKEALAILEKHEQQAGGELDRHKMLQMIKRQLVKDKGVII